MTKLEASIVEIVTRVNPSITISVSQLDQPLAGIGLDSLDHANLLLQVEEAFGCKIPDVVSGDLTSVSLIAAFVVQSGAARA
jgi:acyl carrier protein